MKEELHVHHTMARLHGKGDIAGCAAAAQKRLKEHRNDGLSWYWLARCLLAARNHGDALIAATHAHRLRPRDARTATILGDVHAAMGEAPLALSLWEQAIQLLAAGKVDPGEQDSIADVYGKMGDLLFNAQQLDAAVMAFRSAIQFGPLRAQSWFNLGITLMGLERNGDAERVLQQALTLGYPEAEGLSALGVALMGQQQWSRAQEALSRSLQLNSVDAKVLNNLSIVCQYLGRLEDAEALLRQKLHLNPQDVMGWVNLGNVLRDAKRFADSESAFQTALSHAPRDFAALSGLGALYSDTHSFGKAVHYFREAVKEDASVHPQYVNTMTMLGSALATLGQHAEAEHWLTKALEMRPDNRQIWASWLFVLNNHPNKTADAIFSEYQRFDRQFRRPRFDGVAGLEGAAEPGPRRIRVGYVSADFLPHSVQHFLVPLLANHDRSRFEITAFANMAGPEQVGAVYMPLVDHWCFIKGLTDNEVAKLVSEKQIDILVDLSGHTGGSRLDVFALKPAPVSVSWLGFGGTTGLSSMDYYLVDAHAMPAMDEAFFSEKPWRLERPYLVYRPNNAMGPVGELPALTAGIVTFASLSRTIRFNDQLFAAWADILKRVPGSVLLLNSVNLKDPALVADIEARFVALGIERNRVRCGLNSPPWDLLRTVDISLDCFPHNSGTTLLESLYMGIPYITLTGRPGVGRLGGAILHGAGHPEWIASDVNEYIEKAVQLAGDLPGLARIRASLRDEMMRGALMDEVGFARSVEEAYARMLAEPGVNPHR